MSAGAEDGHGPRAGGDHHGAVRTLEDLRRLLRGLGASDEEIAHAEHDGTLALLAVERLLAPQDVRYTLHEVATRTGLTAATIELIWRSLGYPQPRPGEPAFNDIDVELLSTVGELMASEVTSLELVVQMSRVIGSSTARIASAHVDVISARAGLVSAGVGGEVPVTLVPDDRLISNATTVLELIPKVIEVAWRRHVYAAARRRMTLAETGLEQQGAVGFADLVGFTALSQQMSEAELAAVVDQFEDLCFDVVTAGGGRVVKMIGDEVMFTVDAPDAAAEMALALAEGTRDADELSDVRVGLAYGSVIEREGDLYGPVVNLASRITAIAFPGSIVVSRELRDLLVDSAEYTIRPMRYRYLKHIGRVPLFVLRRSSGSQSRFAGRRQALREAVRARVEPPGAG
ncbi:MAG TPA: adenylate/guanylate cyclase domain-containing protein [Acidimicrobiales bacterium]|nr:adenylate/guanylate cyclase domain-containing protein [Acidimicrobiales bacterium]